MSTCLPEDNKINLINIQPTTKFVDKKGPSTNPEYYVKKVDFDKKLSTVPTNETVVSISNSLITNALDNYYDKDHIDGQLSCKSNTDHTHTTINNTLTVNNKRLNLYSNNKYTYLVIGKQDANHQSIMFGFGDDDKGQYAYLRVQGGSQLTLFDDKATFPGELTVNTLNGIAPSTISLNTHNHDNAYSKIEHTHSTNDITDVNTLAKADHNHDNAYSKIEHTHSTNDITDVNTLAKADHNHDNAYSKLVHTHKYNDLENNYFKIKSETKEGREDTDYFIVYDASELLNKEQNELHPGANVKLKIKFFDNVEITVTQNALSIKVGTKEFKFSETGLTEEEIDKTDV